MYLLGILLLYTYLKIDYHESDVITYIFSEPLQSYMDGKLWVHSRLFRLLEPRTEVAIFFGLATYICTSPHFLPFLCYLHCIDFLFAIDVSSRNLLR